MYKNPPQRFEVLSLQVDRHHRQGLSRVWPLLARLLRREPGLALSVTLSPGCKHGVHLKLPWALAGSCGLIDDQADCQRRWPQDQHLNQLRSDSKDR